MYNTAIDDNAITEADYTFCEPPLGHDSEVYGVRLKTGKYENTIFTFGSIKIVEMPDGSAKLHFNYKVEEGKADIEDDPAFGDYISRVLHHIIETSVQEQNESGLSNDSTEKPNNE